MLKSIFSPNAFKFTVRLLITFLILSAVCLAEDHANPPPQGFFDFWLIPRVWVAFIFGLAGLFLLISFRVTTKVRNVFQFLALFIFSVVAILPLGSFAQGMGLHPSPVCVIEKPIIWGEWPLFFMSILSSIIVLSIIGSKLFCGWICPVGALQEMVYNIPFSKKLNKKLKKKLSFRLTNSIRIGIFILFLILLFSAGFSIYAYFNPFEFLHWEWSLYLAMVMLVTLIAAIFVYRPFCYLVCPMGLLTWFFEHISITKIRFDESRCTHCNICIRKSPCPTVEPIMDLKKIRPDCHACGKCIEVCPEKALIWK